MNDLHLNTPLVESRPLSRLVRGTVWLKMDALQPSGSFKLRGMGFACSRYVENGAKRFVCSSGGNAGVAVAYAGRKLGVPVTVVVPESTTARAIEVIGQEEAEVIVHGKIWQDAHNYAMDLVSDESVYIHPFDDQLLWQGHATVIDEVNNMGIRPDIVILSVGGGGLLCGVMEGLDRNNLESVPVLAVETEGAASLAASLKAGRLVAIEDITSVATSLGAKQVARAAFERSLGGRVISRVVTDRAAVRACLDFSTDHRLLVEPACGASLAAVYDPPAVLADKENILVIVCGGAGVTMDYLQNLKARIE